tara:strand:- start:306 stop:830 length:525 start_codon:yes stop_codon:yes gene_type:complete
MPRGDNKLLQPTEYELELMKEIYAIEGENLVLKRRYHKGEVGDVVGYNTEKGYKRVKLNYQHFRVHRIVWFLSRGVWPTLYIDHIDGDKTNNTPENLREVTPAENSRGYREPIKKSSGYRGVHKYKSCWKAVIGFESKKYNLGLYECEHEAAEAYNKKALELGFFPEALNKIER